MNIKEIAQDAIAAIILISFLTGLDKQFKSWLHQLFRPRYRKRRKKK